MKKLLTTATLLCCMFFIHTAEASPAPIGLTTRVTKRAVRNQAKSILEFRKKVPSFINAQRYQAGTGYNGRFLLQKTRLQSGTIGNVRRTLLVNERGGVYHNTLQEFTKMSDIRASSKNTEYVRITKRSARVNK